MTRNTNLISAINSSRSHEDRNAVSTMSSSPLDSDDNDDDDVEDEDKDDDKDDDKVLIFARTLLSPFPPYFATTLVRHD